MNRDDIIRMAREAGDWNGQTAEFNDIGLEALRQRGKE
jgi:hypothetical protein